MKREINGGKLTFVLLLLVCLASTKDPITVNVGVIEAEPFCIAKRNPQGNITGWSGFIPDVVNKLGNELAFLPSYQLVPDNKYGSYNKETKTWSGLIGEVAAHRVDFAAAPLTVSAQREAHVDFTHELLDIGLVTLTKRPERLEPRVSRGAGFFLGVFDSGVWGSALAAFVVTSFLLHLNDRYNPREAQAKVSEHLAASTASASPLRQFTPLGSAFFTLSTGLFQGYQRAPRSVCGRCLSLFWWVFACIFAATYTAGLLCALVASESHPDDTFSHMDARDQYNINKEAMSEILPLWVPNGNTDAFIRNSTDPLFQFFYRRRAEGLRTDSKASAAKNVTEIVALLKQSYKYVAILESPMADYYARQSQCQLVVASSLLTDRSYAFAFPENSSSLLNRVNAGILKLRETGFIRQAYQRHLGGPLTPCRHAENTMASVTVNLAGEELARMFRDSVPITLKTFAGPVAMYFISLLVSVAAAVFDMQVYAKLEKHRHGAQVLRNAQQEGGDEPSFSALGFREQQQQQQQEVQQQSQDQE